MLRISTIVLASVLMTSTAFAQAPAATAAATDCEAKAVGKNGKPLAGAAKASFLKKCNAGTAPADSGCAAKAVGKNGKALAGAAKNSFIKKCEADAAAAH